MFYRVTIGATTGLVLAWSLLLTLADGPLLTTSLANLIELFGWHFTAHLLFVVGFFSAYALIRHDLSLTELACVLPLAVVWISAAFGPVRAIILSSYLDGVIHPRDFIATDQLIYPIVAGQVIFSIYLRFFIRPPDYWPKRLREAWDRWRLEANRE